MTRAQRIEALDSIADRCGVARATFVLRGEDELHIKPDFGEKYEGVDCALDGVKKLGVVKMGFVGNEAYVADDK